MASMVGVMGAPRSRTPNEPGAREIAGALYPDLDGVAWIPSDDADVFRLSFSSDREPRILKMAAPGIRAVWREIGAFPAAQAPPGQIRPDTSPDPASALSAPHRPICSRDPPRTPPPVTAPITSVRVRHGRPATKQDRRAYRRFAHVKRSTARLRSATSRWTRGERSAVGRVRLRPAVDRGGVVSFVPSNGLVAGERGGDWRWRASCQAMDLAGGRRPALSSDRGEHRRVGIHPPRVLPGGCHPRSARRV